MYRVMKVLREICYKPTAKWLVFFAFIFPGTPESTACVRVVGNEGTGSAGAGIARSWPTHKSTAWVRTRHVEKFDAVNPPFPMPGPVVPSTTVPLVRRIHSPLPRNVGLHNHVLELPRRSVGYCGKLRLSRADFRPVAANERSFERILSTQNVAFRPASPPCPFRTVQETEPPDGAEFPRKGGQSLPAVRI